MTVEEDLKKIADLEIRFNELTEKLEQLKPSPSIPNCEASPLIINLVKHILMQLSNLKSDQEKLCSQKNNELFSVLEQFAENLDQMFPSGDQEDGEQHNLDITTTHEVDDDAHDDLHNKDENEGLGLSAEVTDQTLNDLTKFLNDLGFNLEASIDQEHDLSLDQLTALVKNVNQKIKPLEPLEVVPTFHIEQTPLDHSSPSFSRINSPNSLNSPELEVHDDNDPLNPNSATNSIFLPEYITNKLSTDLTFKDQKFSFTPVKGQGPPYYLKSEEQQPKSPPVSPINYMSLEGQNLTKVTLLTENVSSKSPDQAKISQLNARSLVYYIQGKYEQHKNSNTQVVFNFSEQFNEKDYELIKTELNATLDKTKDEASQAPVDANKQEHYNQFIDFLGKCEIFDKKHSHDAQEQIGFKEKIIPDLSVRKISRSTHHLRP